MIPKSKIQNKAIHIFLLKSIFSRKVILKTLYSYIHLYKSELTENKRFYNLILRSITSEDEIQLEKTMLGFQRELIDNELRAIVYKETKNIRDLYIAKAFSHFEK